MQKDGKERVGVIGLGIIGTRVAERLRSTDRHVYVWNRSPRPVPNFLGSPEEMARLADTIQIFVPGGEALLEVVKRMRSELAKRHTIIANCTADPQSVVDAYEMVASTGASFLDAPFTGSREAAEKGALVYYLGGDPKVAERSRSLLESSAKEVLYLGRVGEASVLKIATNMISGGTMQILAEAFGIVAAAGIDPSKLQEAIEHHACSSAFIRTKLETSTAGDFSPHFYLKHLFKDAQYALGLGKSLGVELPALSTAANIMFRTIQKGKGEFDFSVLAERYRPAEIPPKVKSGDAR